LLFLLLFLSAAALGILRINIGRTENSTSRYRLVFSKQEYINRKPYEQQVTPVENKNCKRLTENLHKCAEKQKQFVNTKYSPKCDALTRLFAFGVIEKNQPIGTTYSAC